MTDKTRYWLELSEYDLETAQARLQTKRYLYVGFMCLQAIEKALKAWFVQSKEEMPPYTHNLGLIAEKGGLVAFLSQDQLDLLDMLEPLNIETRYPAYKEQLLKHLDHKKCVDLLEKTRTLHQWIKDKL